MSLTQDNKTPTTAELQKFIRELTVLEFFSLDGKGSKYIGALRWFDEEAFHIKQDDGSEMTLLRSAILGYRAKKAK
ncbi:MAG: hypothetical protein WC028_14405 [Candidatus Obscuribacterales bacterium]